MKRRWLGQIIIILSATSLAACSGDDDSPAASGDKSQLKIKIGFSGALSGLYAPFDQPALEGMRFAADQINASDDSVDVTIVSNDNKGEPQATATQTQKFIDDGVLLNVVGVGEGRVAAGRLISDAGGVALGALNTYPGWVGQAGENAFLLSVPDNVQGSAIAQWACGQDYRTAYTVASDDTAYTSGLPTYFADAFDHYCGGRIVGKDAFSLGTSDFGAQVTNLKSADPAPDFVFSSMFVPDSNTFVKQLRQGGEELPFVTTDANYLPDFTKAAGAAATGTVMSTFGFASPGSPLEAFNQAFEKLTGSPPATPEFEAIARDQVYGLVQAAKQAKSVEPADVREQLGKLPEDTFVALRQSGGLDPTTRLPTTAELTIVKVQDGSFKPLNTTVPDYVPKPAR
jgi:branched-chain amino acid transport system substrate-binding protein